MVRCVKSPPSRRGISSSNPFSANRFRKNWALFDWGPDAKPCRYTYRAMYCLFGSKLDLGIRAELMEIAIKKGVLDHQLASTQLFMVHRGGRQRPKNSGRVIHGSLLANGFDALAFADPHGDPERKEIVRAHPDLALNLDSVRLAAGG